MRKMILTGASLVALICLGSCSNIIRITKDKQVTRNYDVPAGVTIDGIEVTGAIDVNYIAGEPSIKVLADEQSLKYLKLKYKGNTLEVSLNYANNSSSDWQTVGLNRYVNVTVSSPHISTVKLTGSGDFKAGDLNASTFSLALQGSGDIEISSITSDNLSILSQGSGDVEINDVKSTNASLLGEGSGSCDIKRLSCETLSISRIGSGSTEIDNVTANRIEGNLQGSGDLSLKGSCQSGRFYEAGSGDVDVDELKGDVTKIKR